RADGRGSARAGRPPRAAAARGRSGRPRAGRLCPHQLGRDGFACCLSAYGGVVTAGTDPLHLPRIPVSPWHLPPGHFGFELLAMALAAPARSQGRVSIPEVVGAGVTS